MGMFWLLTGFVAYAPINTPVLSLERSVLSRSLFDAQAFLYCSTALLFSRDTNASTQICSGEMTPYVAPNNVSGLVVNTLKESPMTPFPLTAQSLPSGFGLIGVDTLKSMNAPSLLPIQWRCICLMCSGQSSVSRSASRRSAYAVIFSIHCRMRSEERRVGKE